MSVQFPELEHAKQGIQAMEQALCVCLDALRLFTDHDDPEVRRLASNTMNTVAAICQEHTA